jgi:hypothetical protein
MKSSMIFALSLAPHALARPLSVCASPPLDFKPDRPILISTHFGYLLPI